MVREVLLQVFANGATKAVEDAFHADRVQEERTGEGEIVSVIGGETGIEREREKERGIERELGSY